MTRYRIVGNGEEFRVHVKGWLFWHSIHEYDEYGYYPPPAFQSYEAAEFFVQKRLEEESIRRRAWTIYREL